MRKVSAASMTESFYELEGILHSSNGCAFKFKKSCLNKATLLELYTGRSLRPGCVSTQPEPRNSFSIKQDNLSHSLSLPMLFPGQRLQVFSLVKMLVSAGPPGLLFRLSTFHAGQPGRFARKHQTCL